MNFNFGFDIKAEYNPLGFTYGSEVFGPKVENRKLEDIRKSLLDPNCSGPEIVYSIAMDVGKYKDKKVLLEKNLLFGVVTYASGKLGEEPIRSQGHIHGVSKSCNCSTPEVYEIWCGEAIIYMQESGKDNPGRCFAVKALPSEIVIVPPGWAHATISANPKVPLTFGAWCVRDYGFDYKDVREHKGLAYFPILDDMDSIYWTKNKNYKGQELIEKSPRIYNEFSIESGKSIYTQFEENPNKFLFVAKPILARDLWSNFVP